jgi:uncharacterized Zn finger protein
MDWSARFAEALGLDLKATGVERVSKLVVEAYEVSAEVQTAGELRRSVAIGIQGPSWDRLEAEIAAYPLLRAQLLDDRLPVELGVALLPSMDELHLMCDCPDSVPCRHTDAALRALAKALDRDPFLILDWNGRSQDELRSGLRRRPVAEPDTTDLEDTPLTATDFWTPASGLARLRERTPRPKPPPGLLMELLEPPKIKVRRSDLVDLLAPVYEALARLP